MAALLGKTNALVLAVSPAPTVSEGTWESNWTVLMRFDTSYENGIYQETCVLIRTRAASINNVVLLPTFDPAVLGG
ncbi:MAG: hypothetical protein AAF636_23940 [Pseudomonadota bacterium]